MNLRLAVMYNSSTFNCVNLIVEVEAGFLPIKYNTASSTKAEHLTLKKLFRKLKILSFSSYYILSKITFKKNILIK